VADRACGAGTAALLALYPLAAALFFAAGAGPILGGHALVASYAWVPAWA
jgi:hypothetical protein